MAEPDLSAGSLIPELPYCLMIRGKRFRLDKEISGGGGEAGHFLKYLKERGIRVGLNI